MQFVRKPEKNFYVKEKDQGKEGRREDGGGRRAGREGRERHGVPRWTSDGLGYHSSPGTCCKAQDCTRSGRPACHALVKRDLRHFDGVGARKGLGLVWWSGEERGEKGERDEGKEGERG